MNIVDRVKNILLTPRTEWDVVAAEPPNRADLVLKYVLPLAAIAALAGFVGSSILGGLFGVRLGIVWGLIMIVYNLVMAVVMVFVVGFIIDALAPSFGGQKNGEQAFKAAAYTYTPVWVAGSGGIVPILGGLLVLAGVIYAIYLLFLGLPRLMRAPEDKSAGYTAVTIIVALVVGFVISAIGGLITAPAMLGAAVMSGGSSPVISGERQAALGKLEDYARKLEAAGKKMDAAQKSGDATQQAAAAMEALGTAMSGGRKVEALSVEQIKGFVPETFAGLTRSSQSAERSGVAGFVVATAKATYSDPSGKQVRLEVTDAGGAGAMMGLAAWMGAVGMEREDDNGAERTRKEGNRLVHEKVSKRGGANEYDLVLAERFIVKAVGTGVDLAALKGGVGSLDLAKLESLKDAGVAKN